MPANIHLKPINHTMQNIQQYLSELRLGGMLQQWESLNETNQMAGLSLTEGLQLLLQTETEYRQERRTNRLTRNAGFRYQANLSDIAYTPQRNLDKNTIHHLATNQYIRNGRAVLITGPTGSGKSYVASALGYHSCDHGFKTAYFNMQKLLGKLKIARADGSIIKVFDKLAKTNLLIIDDFGLAVLEAQARLDLLEIIEDRHRKKATIIASQLPVSHWYDIIGDDTIADAILDRLTSHAEVLELKGESLRKTM